MKRSLYIVALTAGLAQAAATDTFQPIVIAQTPAWVSNSMVRGGLEKTDPTAFASPVGGIYVHLSCEGINSLGQNPPVVAKTNIYNNAVQANATLQKLIANAVQLVETEGPEAERIVALALLGAKYGRLLKKLVQTDIPGLKLRPTLPATIEKNTGVALDDEQKICFKAAQLAMGGLNLQEQWNIDPKTFAIMFKRYMPVELHPIWPNSSDDEGADAEDTVHEYPIVTQASSKEEAPSLVADASKQSTPKKGWWPIW